MPHNLPIFTFSSLTIYFGDTAQAIYDVTMREVKTTSRGFYYICDRDCDHSWKR